MTHFRNNHLSWTRTCVINKYQFSIFAALCIYEIWHQPSVDLGHRDAYLNYHSNVCRPPAGYEV